MFGRAVVSPSRAFSQNLGTDRALCPPAYLINTHGSLHHARCPPALTCIGVRLHSNRYVKHGLHFVMGTTGGDRGGLTEAHLLSGKCKAVVAPSMAKQIVALQVIGWWGVGLPRGGELEG